MLKPHAVPSLSVFLCFSIEQTVNQGQKAFLFSQFQSITFDSARMAFIAALKGLGLTEGLMVLVGTALSVTVLIALVRYLMASFMLTTFV